MTSSGATPDYVVGGVSVRAQLNSDNTLLGTNHLCDPRAVQVLDFGPGGGNPEHTGSTVCHEIGHGPPFDLGDTYKDGKHRDANPLPADPSKFDDAGILIFEEDLAYSPSGSFPDPRFMGPVWSDFPRPDLSLISAHDFMGNSRRGWVDRPTAERLFMLLGGSIPGTQLAHKGIKTVSPALVVRGQITPPDTVTFLPFNTLPGPEPAGSVTPENAEYTIELQDGPGNVLDTAFLILDLEVETVGIDPDTGIGFASYDSMSRTGFRAVLRDDPAGQRVVVKQGETVLATLERSANDPVVTLDTGNGPGDFSGDEITISWTGSDPDPGDEDHLFYDVLYTPDDGTTIHPFAVDLTETTTITFTTTGLPGGGDARFMVRVSDLWNTSEVSSDPPFTPPDREPTIKICSPDAMADILEGQPVKLLGISIDPEDGILIEDGIVWTLNGDPDPFAMGQSTFVTFPQGAHTLRATATDSFGHVVFDEISLQIDHPPASSADIADHLLGRIPEPEGADVNGDGIVDIGDVISAVEQLR